MTEAGAFLERFWIGMALHLWQTTVIFAVLLILGLGLRRAPARYTNAIAWIALFKLLLPLSLLGGLGLSLFGIPGAAVGPVALSEYVRVVLEPAALSASAEGRIDSRFYVYATLSVAWIFGVALLLTRWARRSGAPSDTTHKLAAARPEIRSRVEQALAGTSIAPESVRIGSASIPAVRGLIRPTILIPEPVVVSLEREPLRAVLLHEEAHRRRRDTWRAVVWRIALAVYFFYPPVWWLVARLRASAELACDESVLSDGVSSRVYSRALARVLATGLGLMPASHPAEVALGRPGSLRARLDRIENPWRYRAMTRHRVLAGFGVLVLAGSLFAPSMSSAPETAQATTNLVEVAPPPEIRFADLDRLALEPNPIHLEFDDTSLATVFSALTVVTKIEFQGADKLSRKVSVSYANLTPREILVRLGSAFRLDYMVVDPWVLRVHSRSPMIAGTNDVSNPTLRPDSKVDPVYPEAARADKVEGSVILQALILIDGTVSEIELLRASRPDYPGFEEAAIEAVRQWRYEPALKDGVPVDTYFTIYVEFKLN